jgi:hypothetical protein
MSDQDRITRVLKEGARGLDTWPDWMQQLTEKERVVKEIVNDQQSSVHQARTVKSVVRLEREIQEAN